MESQEFPFKEDIRQGETLSSPLFNLVMDDVGYKNIESVCQSECAFAFYLLLSKLKRIDEKHQDMER